MIYYSHTVWYISTVYSTICRPDHACERAALVYILKPMLAAKSWFQLWPFNTSETCMGNRFFASKWWLPRDWNSCYLPYSLLSSESKVGKFVKEPSTGLTRLHMYILQMRLRFPHLVSHFLIGVERNRKRFSSLWHNRRLIFLSMWILSNCNLYIYFSDLHGIVCFHPHAAKPVQLSALLCYLRLGLGGWASWGFWWGASPRAVMKKPQAAMDPRRRRICSEDRAFHGGNNSKNPPPPPPPPPGPWRRW